MQLRRVLCGFLVAALAGCDPETSLIGVPPSLALSNTALTPTATLGGAATQSSVLIVNGTDGTLENLTTQVSYGGPATGWLSVTLNRTTATRDLPAEMQVRATPGTLTLGSYDATIRVTAAGAGNGPITVTVRFTIQPRPPTRLSLTTQPAPSVANGLALGRQPVVQLLDAVDQPALRAGVPVTASISTGGGQLSGTLSLLTDANGRAAFTDLTVTGLVGDRTLTFSAPSLASATSAPVTITPGAPRRLEAASPTTVVADAGTAVSEVPRVRVVDESGNGVTGVSVGVSVSAGSAADPAGPLITATSGIAGPTNWTLNRIAGTNTLTATVNGLAGSPLTFSATGRPGPASQLVKQSGDNLIGLVGTTLATPLVVRVADQFGNGVAGSTVTWSVTGGGSTSPATSTTSANGLAETRRTLPATAGLAATQATVTIGGAPVTAVFSATAANAGPAQIIRISGDGQTGAVATTLPVPLRVQVLDALGAPTPDVTVTFTTPDAGGAFPGGLAVRTDAGGFAQSTWRLGTMAGPQTAQAAVGGPAPITFGAVATPGTLAVTQSSVTTSPATITAGGAPTSIRVTARDGFGNAIPGLTVAVTSTGGGTLVQPTGPTNAQGQATATYSSTVSGAKVVSASIAGQSLPQTATVTVTAGAPASFVSASATVFAVRFGQSVATLPSVRVLDAFGNGVSGVNVTFGLTSGQSSVSTPTVTTNAAGTATVGSWLIAAFTGSGAPQNVYNRLVASVSLATPTTPITFTGIVTVSYNTDLYPYLQSCAGGGCHSIQAPVVTQTPAALYGTLLNPTQRYVISGDSTSSSTTTNLLWRKLSGLQSHAGGTRLAEVVTIIKAWIREGAPNN